jgi:hypothetical protein
LLDEPWTGPLHPPTAQRQPQFLVLGIVHGRTRPFQLGISSVDAILAGSRHPLHGQRLRPVSQDPGQHPRPQAVPCPANPLARLAGPPLLPGRCACPQLLRGVIKVHNAPCMARAALLTEAPQPTATGAAPDHLRCAPDPWAHRYEPQTRGEGCDVSQHGHQPALDQACDPVPCPGVMLAQPGEHTDVALAPADLPSGCAPLRSQRPPPPIRPQSQGQGGMRTDQASPGPAQQARSRGTGHAHGHGPAQGLQHPAGPLMRLHPQGRIELRGEPLTQV